jgi:hypothetical protein
MKKDHRRDYRQEVRIGMQIDNSEATEKTRI